MAVEDAVVDGERHIGHGTDLDGVGAADIAHHETFFELADAQNG